MSGPKRQSAWDGFEPIQREERRDGALGVVLMWLLIGGGGFVFGGLTGILVRYSQRGGERGPDIDAMLADTDEKAMFRFLVGGAIGAALAWGWLLKTRLSARR
jgi:hypothetical protein